MKNLVILLFLTSLACLPGCHAPLASGPAVQDTLLLSDTIQYHPVRISKADGSILPWYSADPGCLL